MENNKNMTAVEWFIDWLMDNPITSDGYIEAMIKAKQMEKEQIIDARANGFMSSAEGWNGEVPCMKWSEVITETKCEQYYNKTYGKP